MMHNLLGLGALTCLVVVIWFAFRQGLGVKPDPDNRDNWTNYSGGGDSGADGGGHHF